MKNINKFRYNIRNALLTLVAGLLFLTVLFSALIWFVSGAFLPFIVSGILFTTFTVLARIKYGLKFVELLNDKNIQNQNNRSNLSLSPYDTIKITNINHKYDI
ncbi:hypothetical protein [Mucispirillum schaedleri]|uniref:hypothetical protein n=1 Tax=Mucispirillum schaedleri TaxID=248039 RepID=UPI001F5631DA|nr:hypothetical protein [Mucispirillum schaedleri]